MQKLADIPMMVGVFNVVRVLASAPRKSRLWWLPGHVLGAENHIFDCLSIIS